MPWSELGNGTLVVWDNHATQHMAPADYLPEFRLMHRSITRGHGRMENYIVDKSTNEQYVHLQEKIEKLY